MAATILVNTDGIVIDTAWYQVLRFIRRSSDEALVAEVAEWRRTGSVPPTGFVKPDGTLTQDADEAYAFPISARLAASEVRAMIKQFAIIGERKIQKGDMDDDSVGTDQMEAGSVTEDILDNLIIDRIKGAIKGLSFNSGTNNLEVTDNRDRVTTVSLAALVGGLDSGLNQAAVDGRINTLRPNAFSDEEKAKLDGIDTDEIDGSADASTMAFNTGTRDLTIDDNNGVTKTVNIPGGGTSGLDQAAVDARIDNAIPTDRRLPDPGTLGDAGKHVRVNATATGYETANQYIESVESGEFVVSQGKLELAGANIPDPGTGNAGKVPKPDASGNITWQDDNTGTGGGGLTGSQVDQRIDNRIPVARRLPTFGQGDAKQVLTVADDGNSTDFEPLDVENWARRDAIPGATSTKARDMFDSFTGDAGWEDVSGATTTVPAVRSVTKATAFTTSDIIAGTYLIQAPTGVNLGVRHIAVRIPVGYELASLLGRMRLRVGVGIGSEDEDPNLNSYLVLKGNATLIRTTGTYHYYDIEHNIPAGTRWSIQVNEPWEFNPDNVRLPDGFVSTESIRNGAVTAEKLAGDAVSQEKVYNEVKDIIVDSVGIRTVNNDGDSTITFTSPLVAAARGNALPDEYRAGEVFFLTETHSNYHADRLFAWDNTMGDVAGITLSDTNGMLISAYDDDWTNSNPAIQAALRGKVALFVPPQQLTNLPTSIALYKEGDARKTFTHGGAINGAPGYYVLRDGGSDLTRDSIDETVNYYANVFGGSAPSYTRSFDGGFFYKRGGTEEAAWVREDFEVRFTAALQTKLNALPDAADIQFDNHPIGTAAALNALSRTTDGLDFVTITANITSGITANIVYDGFTNAAISSLARGDLLVLDHANNRWTRVVNLGSSATTTLPWASVTGKPATATRWPTYAEVTGTKPPANAAANPAIIPQSEAEGGNASTGRLTSGQRMRQAIVAWWGATSVAWSKLTSVPAFASRWPTWAEVTGKPTLAPSNAEQNVQADWTETDTASDAYIENKPEIPEDFTDLDDTPANYTNQGGKYVAVNSGANALEFVDAPTGGGGTVDDDSILDLAKETRTTADRGKALGTSSSDENALTLFTVAEAIPQITNMFPADPEDGDKVETTQSITWPRVADVTVAGTGGNFIFSDTSGSGNGVNLDVVDSIGWYLSTRNLLVRFKSARTTPSGFSLNFDGNRVALTRDSSTPNNRDYRRNYPVNPFAPVSRSVNIELLTAAGVATTYTITNDATSGFASRFGWFRTEGGITPTPSAFTAAYFTVLFATRSVSRLVFEGNPTTTFNRVRWNGVEYNILFDTSEIYYYAEMPNPFLHNSGQRTVLVTEFSDTPSDVLLPDLTFDAFRTLVFGPYNWQYTPPSINGEGILDLAQETRTTADRGKFLGVSSTDEDELALLTAPSGGGTLLTQAQATSSTSAVAGLISGQRIRQAITAWWNGTSVAWSKLTSIPAFASRWPSYTEVTGTKPPTNAQANPAILTQAEATSSTSDAGRLASGRRLRQAITAWWNATTISAAKIASNAVTSVKIAANAVTTGKIANLAVTRGKLAADQQVPALTGQGGKYVAVNSSANALELVDAPTGGGGTTTPPGIKLVSLTTPAGDTATGGSHTNRKVLNSGNIATSAWSALALTNDATAVRGITVASNAIVFANASQEVTVTVTCEFNSSAEGNTTRLYNKVRGALTRASTTTHPLEMRSNVVYTKVRATQGVATQCLQATWDIEVQAGDTLAIEWEMNGQNVTYVDLVPANSQVKVKLR